MRKIRYLLFTIALGIAIALRYFFYTIREFANGINEDTKRRNEVLERNQNNGIILPDIPGSTPGSSALHVSGGAGLDMAKTQTTVTGDSTLQLQEVSLDGYTLKISTIFLNDSTIDAPRFNPVVLSQRLLFYKSGRLLTQTISPAKQVERELASGRRLAILDNVIYQIGTITGSRGSLFAVEGTGACNACAEMRMLFTLYGHRKFCFYGSLHRTIIGTGDVASTYRRYGVTDSSKEEMIDLNLVKYYF